MVFSVYKAATALLLAGSIGAEAASVAARTPTANDRVLRAGTKRSAHKRSTKIEPTFALDLPYIEEPTRYNGHSIFASNLKVASKKPILNLEDIEHHLEDVQCVNGKVTLKFADTSSAIDARLACHGPEGGIIVTSHLGCNPAGERSVYTVHGASASGDGSTLELDVMESLFEHAFDRIEVGFGHTEEHHSIREHTDLKIRKRQLARLEGAIGTAETVAADAEMAEGMAAGAKNATEVLGEVPEDSDPNVHDAKFDLKWEVTNKTFKPDEFLAGLPVGFTLTNMANLPLELTCKKCLTRGEIILSQGNIEIDTAALKAIPDKLKEIPGMIASAIPSAIAEIGEKMDEAKDKLESKVDQAADKVTSKVGEAVDKVTSIIDAVPSKVESVAETAVAAITSIAGAVESKAESIINNIPIPTKLPDIDLNPFDRRTKMAKRGVDFDLGKVITGGFVELKANGLEAYFELGAKPKSTGYFTFRVLELPILGFVIPGVGRAGAVFEALLEADYEMEGGFEMSYGMNLEVPSNSTMRIDLGDMSKTGVSGFQDSTLTPLPFNFEKKQLDAFVSVAMVPSIPIGFKFLSVLDVGVEAELDLPRLDALISTIDDADTQCNDLSYEDEEGATDETEDGTTDETEDGTTDETEDGTTDETEDGTTDETEDGTTDETDDSTTDETDDSTTDETEDGTTDETEDGTTDETDDGTTDETEDSTTDETDDSTTDETDDSTTDDTEDTPSADSAEEKALDAKDGFTAGKRSVAKRNVKAIRRATKARRAPASRQATHARNLKRQNAAPFPLANGTNSTQPDKLSLVYIEWNVSMSAILGFNFVLPAMPMVIPGVDTNALNPFKPIRKHKTVFTTVKTMPTLCLAPEKGFRPATDVYTDPVETDVGTIGTGVGTGVGTIGTAAPTAGKPKFTNVPESNSTDFKLKRRQYGYGVAIPPYTEATPTPTPTPTPAPSTSTPCESSATPPPVVESNSTEVVESSSEVPPPPPESTPESTSTPCTTSTDVPPPPPATTEVVESTSSDIPPPPETTPAESSSVPPPPPAGNTSTPCTTETPPPAPPTSTPCTTGSTITLTLPYNTSTPAYEPTGTASPPVPSAPAEFPGAASTMLPTMSAVFLAFLAMLVL
ncbi:hypothetical protein DPSP01_000582 [Paraphaeosphaeria sporulosa]